MYENSPYLESSVASYEQDSPNNNTYGNNILKYLQQKNELRSREQEHQPSSPMIVKRHNSQNSYNAFLQSRSPGGGNLGKGQPEEKGNTFHNTFNNRFYQSIVQSLGSKNNFASTAPLQKEINDISAREISRMTENQLLRKEIKKLKAEIVYLNEKSQKLQRKNEKLMACKSRVEILQREYQTLLQEYLLLKESQQGVFPLTIDRLSRTDGFQSQPNHSPDGFQLGRQATSRVVGQVAKEGNGKGIHWKKVSGSISPINRIEKRVNLYDQLPLIESKIDSEDRQVRNPIAVREEARTIDIKDFEKSRSQGLERKVHALEQQIQELRVKNINLLKKCEEYESEKLKNLEEITELKYDKTKCRTDLRDRQATFQKEKEKTNLQLETNRIKTIELNQQITRLQEEGKLLQLEKEELQKEVTRTAQQAEKDKQNEDERKRQQQGKLARGEEKCRNLEQRTRIVESKNGQLLREIGQINTKLGQKEIQNKLLEQQIEEKKDLIAELERQLKTKAEACLEQESYPSRNIPNQPVVSQKQTSKQAQAQIVTLIHELSLLRDHNTQLLQQTKMTRYESDRLQTENKSLRESYNKLTKIFEHQKQENIKLNELRDSWRQIELQTKKMKQIDASVDHLWQIKQVEYDNIHAVLGRFNEQSL